MLSSRSLKYFLFIFLALLILLSYFYVDDKVEKIKEKVYVSTAKDLNKRVQLMVKEKSESILKITLAIAHDKSLKNDLMNNSIKNINLNVLSGRIRQKSSYKYLGFQIIDAKGKSFYRSWSDKRGDSLIKPRLDIAQLIKAPKIRSSISTGKFDMTFKSIVPIYHNDIFIGAVETLGKFDSIAVALLDEGVKPIVLVDKKYKKQLKHSFSKRFCNDYYISSLEVDDDFLQYIEDKELLKLFEKKKAYYIDKKASRLITIYYINDIKDESMGYFLLSKPLESISIDEVSYIKYQFNVFMVGAIAFSFFFLMMIRKRHIQENIENLQSEVQRQTAEIQEQKEVLYHQAHHDTLTNLPNRLLFQDRLEHAIQNAKRNKSHFALLFIDLDRFKVINDSLGHDAGDKVLVEVAKRIKDMVRDSDTVSRLGGDEFTVILENIAIPKDVITIIQKISKSFTKSIVSDKQELYVKSSIGISIYPEDGDTVEDLLKNADAAMYEAKAQSVGFFAFYKSKLTSEAKERLSLENRIQYALDHDQFTIHYQAQYNSEKNEIIGLEALVRWEENGKFIPPISFISMAESTNLILPLGNIIISKVFKDMNFWVSQGLDPIKVSINLSTKQLQDSQLIPFIEKERKSFNIKAEQLCFEVTESAIFDNPEEAIQTLEVFKKLGMSLSLDDFGTGYSSLSYLKKLPIDSLKIDRSFISALPEDKEDAIIVKSIIDLARNMNLKLIAEGVETKAQKDFLSSEKCIYIQGFYYAKPMQASMIEKLLLTKKQG